MLPALDEIVEGLPPLSPSSTRLIELCNDLNAEQKDLVEVIRLDPVLTARILKVINSAYYGMPSTVTRIDRALVLLGFNTVKNIALSTAVLEKLKPREKTAVDLDAMWMNALAVGIASKMIAKWQGVGRGALEDYFTAGLLSDLGAIVLARATGAAYAEALEVARAQHLAIEDAERDRFGFDRVEVGSDVADKWNLPGPIREAVSANFEGEHLAVVDVVHVAATEVTQRREPGVLRPRNNASHERVALDPDTVELVFEELDDELAAASGIVKGGE
jgi:HD-like signal output (HDOD) protein